MEAHVYEVIELVGSSPEGIEEAVRNAIAKAAETVDTIRWFQVIETRGVVEEGEVAFWQVTVKIEFRMET